MNYIEIKERLKDLRNEEIVWLIYIGIIIISWYSNTLEKNYFIYNDQVSKEKYRKLLILIFSILTVVYLYFFKSSFNDVQSLKKTDSNDKIKLTLLSFTASLLILISGIIFLYIAIKDEQIDVELAFN